MAFTNPPPDLDAAQDEVDRAQAALEGTRLLVADGRADASDLNTAMFTLHCALERLAAAKRAAGGDAT